MQQFVRFEDLIFNFCRHHQISIIQPDEQLRYSIYIDNIAVRCYTHQAHIYLEVDLGLLPELQSNTHQLYKHVMQQSLIDSVNSQSIISLSEDNKLTVYCKMSIDQCELSDLNLAIEMLVNQAEVMNEILISHQTSHQDEHARFLGMY